jgi:hypothetical protein
MKDKIANWLNQFPEVVWDRWTQSENWACAYGWIARDDGRFDFLVIDFDDGEPWKFSTSSAKFSKEFSVRLNFEGSTGHQECRRIENDFPGVKACKLL